MSINWEIWERKKICIKVIITKDPDPRDGLTRLELPKFATIGIVFVDFLFGLNLDC